MNVRNTPLEPEELSQYRRDGFLFPIRVLSDERVAELREAIDDHLAGRIGSAKYELTDPIRYAKVRGPDGRVTFEYEGDQESQPRTFGFLFNLWKTDDRFARVGKDAIIAGIARQLLGSERLLLMEDNVVVKMPNSRYLPWHQDFSYWPLAKPAAITVWIALDHITAGNGAMQLVPGSHELGERLPVSFGDARSIMADERPGVTEVPQDPAREGYPVATYELQPGECGFHHAMVWHGSTPNLTRNIRCALALRYLASGTIWLGGVRFPYDDIGCPAGQAVGPTHFPAVPTAF